MIQVKDLSKIYNQRKVLSKVDLTLETGTHCAIRGASGSGKSTLLYLMGGLEKADEGSININGFDICSADEDDLAGFRNDNIGFIFQFHFLLPNLTVRDNLLLPARIGKKLTSELVSRTESLAEHLEVASLMNQYPYQLSGGEQQRVNIIRAFSLNPPIVLCDEPTGNLDSHNTKKVVDLLKSIATESQSTLVVVTHDVDVAKEFNQQLFMQDGKLN